MMMSERRRRSRNEGAEHDSQKNRERGGGGGDAAASLLRDARCQRPGIFQRLKVKDSPTQIKDKERCNHIKVSKNKSTGLYSFQYQIKTKKTDK